MKNHLIIGLGGTGGKIIRSFRKEIYQEYRKEKPDDVFIEYLYVDSSNEFMREDDPTWKILGTSIQLGKNNQCLIEGTALQSVLDNIDDHPGVKPWIGSREQWKDILTQMKAATVLGGQKRRLGRFLFANKVKDFRSQLRRLVSDLHTESGNEQVTFHICCGLAGGTGSGSLIDIICQLRNLYPNPKTYHILIYTLLPDEYPKDGWDTGNYHSNGYASLLELNALSINRWDPHDISGEDGRLKLHDPFNGCYLFENRNENSNIVDVEVELPNIISDFLYMKIVGIKDAGEWIRTMERIENGENGDATPETSPGQDDKTPERSKRFLTFGIKRLAIPEDEIREYLTYTLSEQASRKFLYENWQDGEGYRKEPKSLPFNEIVRNKDNMAKWKLTDEHICLSIGVLDSDLQNKKWLRINEDWPTVTRKIKQAIQKTTTEKRRWLDELKRMCSDHFNKTYRGSGVGQFYTFKRDDKAQIADEICRGIERDLFNSWRTGEYAMTDIGSILDRMIAYTNERLKEIDSKIQKYRNDNDDIGENIKAKDHEWANVTFLKEWLKKYDSLFDVQSDLHRELYISRTWAEAWMFAKVLLPEIISRLEDLKIEINKGTSTMRQAMDKFENGLRTRCNDPEGDDKVLVKHLIRFYQPEIVKQLGKKFRIDENLQRTQINQVRKTLIDKLGNDPNFKVFNDRISFPVYLDTLESECQESAIRAHDENFATSPNQKLLGVSIIDKLYDRFSNDEEALRSYFSKLVRHAGNYLTMSNTEKQRKGPGIPPSADTCVTKFTAIIPESERHADFLDNVENVLKRSRQLGMDIIRTNTKTNEITLVSITNLFPIRFIELLNVLRAKYEARIQKSDSERAKLELHIEGDGTQHPSLVLLSKKQTSDRGIPYFLLAKAMELIQDVRNQSTGKVEMMLITKGEDGLDNPAVNLGTSVAEATENMDAVTVNQMEEHVTRIINSSDAGKKNELKSFVLSHMDELKTQFGPADPFYERVNAGARHAIKMLNVEN